MDIEMNEDCTFNPMSRTINIWLTLREKSVDGEVKTYTTTRKTEQSAHRDSVITLYNLCHHPLYIRR